MSITDEEYREYNQLNNKIKQRIKILKNIFEMCWTQKFPPTEKTKNAYCWYEFDVKIINNQPLFYLDAGQVICHNAPINVLFMNTDETIVFMNDFVKKFQP